jgi:S1-C subfamily serine protease
MEYQAQDPPPGHRDEPLSPAPGVDDPTDERGEAVPDTGDLAPDADVVAPDPAGATREAGEVAGAGQHVWSVAPGGAPEPLGPSEPATPGPWEPPTSHTSGPAWPQPLPAPVVPEHPAWPTVPVTGATGSSAPAASPPGATAARGPRGIGAWLIVAIVAAVIGGAVGAGVVALTARSTTSSTVTIKQGTATPGAAVVNGVSIPSLVQKVLPSVVSIDVKAGGNEDQGTGMIISSNGMVITNNHVIALAAGHANGSITVTESGTTKAQAAQLIGTDPNNDVALVQVTGASGLPTVTFGDSDKVVVGDAVVAIGNALGLAAGTPTVTQGIISALDRTVTAGSTSSSATETLSNLIQTDAAINPGNSGGPLIDSNGQVIGMNTAVAGATSDGTNAQNIGFAIPSNRIESLLPELQAGGVAATSPAYLGVDVATLTPALRQQYGFTPTQGAVILDVVPGSPAGQAGLAQGDVITAVDSTTITSASDLQSAIANASPGQTVTIHYYVGSQAKSVQVKLVANPSS